jgi:lipopolysaccharide biosynthesis regulator YciM
MKKPDLQALRANALLKMAEGDKDGAFENLKVLASSDVEASDAYIITGSLLRDRGDPAKAERIHRSILEKKDLSKEVRDTAVRELIKDCLEAKDYKNVLLLTERAENSLLPIRALAMEKSGHLKEAAELYKKCAKLKPEYIKNAARCWFAASKDSKESRGNAIKLLTYAEKCDPLFFEARAEHANLLFLDGKRSKGLSIIEDIIKYELPKSAEHMQLLEEFYYEHSEIDVLFKLIMKKINSGSANTPFYVYAVRYHMRKSETDKAQSLISIFTSSKGFPSVLAAVCAEMSGNELLNTYFKARPLHKCSVCSCEHTQYADICSNCGSLGTLSYF